MEHYIKEIRIDRLRHLSDIVISLNAESRQHLMITGKNGSGKTSLLDAIQKYLRVINGGYLNHMLNGVIPTLRQGKTDWKNATSVEKSAIRIEAYRELSYIERYKKGIDVLFNEPADLDCLFKQGEFITAYFPADRRTEIIRANGVEDVRLDDFYPIGSEPGKLLHKYMVHLRTQQAFARNEGDLATADRIQEWFDRFVGALRVLLDDDSITLEYDYKEYDFKIHENGRIPFGLDCLSDGYSSVIHIVSDLILRMERNWFLRDELSEYNVEGIVLIDELETHLHIELQRKILPFLTTFFPRIQFIVTTHSPYILNSISNAKVYDLERCMELENAFVYSADGLAEGFFEADEYSDELKEKIERYQYLVEKVGLTEVERAERAKLRNQMRNIPSGLAQEARDKFEEIECHI